MAVARPINAVRLVAEVVGSGGAQARALEIAGVIAQKPPRSAELAKAAVLAAFQTALDAGLEFERQAIRYAFTVADQQEGMNALFEKRAPSYRGN
ncbi:enoyl-CoA hydratase-related protein [Bradyrhizobium sp. SSUT112]|uniref:enoyl-CoA hydratase-related protein n=1 Tax=Bradyrhizobium sp. SSUT112 TaxID=3040604 RepID=UPI00244684B8|nr:enoyl-CoA hydratase-related protein [Bradyrhizobium sp. SSUT112]MDH2357520.1 enoyl-CoA hydratase-related protein [Bradyrhizobium sp. SSUT112]